MKKDAEKTKVPVKDQQEVKSEDIPNAHATGDGAMGRNDEKIGEDDPAGEEKKESESY